MKKKHIAPQALNTSQSALYLGVSEGFLRKLRAEEKGPVYTRIENKRINYLIKDLDFYLQSNRVEKLKNGNEVG